MKLQIKPLADDFAETLEPLFHGDPSPPMTMPTHRTTLDHGSVETCYISLDG